MLRRIGSHPSLKSSELFVAFRKSLDPTQWPGCAQEIAWAITNDWVGWIHFEFILVLLVCPNGHYTEESICSKSNEKQEEISVWEMLYSHMTWLWLLSCSKEAFLRSLSLNHVQEVEDAQILENGGATTARVIFSAKIRNTHIQEIHMQLRSSAYFLVSCLCCLNLKDYLAIPFA